ncbi:CvfD/Ygs/GSP13 family RNA-binding post-transcriptional regulator [Lentilactobacillus kefiri]|uniref:Polyribonucleotide nucleotidyltransferase n=2 Tax=Lentilactobacillus kefiri TaxID=33962 RepID=A0A511DSR5_LENKE|nr:CvfD/Ygs/GSP13 family RNA-binding post-transcriptional regulator [Lentilactobacillus kefiri]MCJ2162313.1 CvfD/Ygs/GSP13 family RNA-binding post-transcriptional regulator [Lentilactobacillus kefiri]MCP9368206.1 S1 RNA-binding domain-containing protein [Lentilactobacillus kefiri]MDH5108973.1 CvfD/Ygs/GSP13 family RNA-binding post-transcriptional regulator [Lentilactobacillus kefiri]MDM7493599.1 CvfD/Ygs/GSP13 family RNA-binding post-transcriptional regulator [Lentilactobacillus kefiri]PAK6037
MKFKVGMTVTGTVTGIQPYGAFVDIGEHTQGLIHISECKSGYVDNIFNMFTIGQPVSTLIIDIDEYSGKISLSMRSHQPDLDLIKHPKNFRPRNIHYWTNYRLNIGFKSLADARSQWMRDARNFFD